MFNILSLVVVLYLLHGAVVADHAPRGPLERGYRRRSQLVTISGDEVLLPLRVAGAEDVHVRRHAALVVEAHVLDLLQDLREELDVEVLRHHHKNQPVSKTKVEPGIQYMFDHRCGNIYLRN